MSRVTQRTGRLLWCGLCVVEVVSGSGRVTVTIEMFLLVYAV